MVDKYYWQDYKPRRDPVMISRDILQACIEPKIITMLMRWANINPFNQSNYKHIVDYLIKMEWLIHDRDTYTTTEQGKKMIPLMEKAVQDLRGVTL